MNQQTKDKIKDFVHEFGPTIFMGAVVGIYAGYAIKNHRAYVSTLQSQKNMMGEALDVLTTSLIANINK